MVYLILEALDDFSLFFQCLWKLMKVNATCVSVKAVLTSKRKNQDLLLHRKSISQQHASDFQTYQDLLECPSQHSNILTPTRSKVFRKTPSPASSFLFYYYFFYFIFYN